MTSEAERTEEEKARNPWKRYRPGSGKKYNPDDPHFNPMHPPDGYPTELLEREWGETAHGDGEET